jgi:hypothetical protein
VVESGQPSRAVSVRRVVYDKDGDLLYDTTWSSSYLAEPKVVRVGTKPKPAATHSLPATTTRGTSTGTSTGTTTGRG